MKKLIKSILIYSLMIVLLTGCGKSEDKTEVSTEATELSETTEAATSSDMVASADEMASPIDVIDDNLTPVYADELKDGEYDIDILSSSSMFNIVSCRLTVENGEMSAVMTMGGTGYLYVYMGTGEEAVAASDSDYIPYVENDNGEHTFTVPVEALDKSISCAAFSKNKEKWYDRQLVFSTDKLPEDAFSEARYKTVEDLGLNDGMYIVSVTLDGGSGRVSVESPASIVVADGCAVATIVWSSSNYDYMIVDGEKYLPLDGEETSTFEIPVTGFDYKMPVSADTTAMSTPHEIEYTLYFDSATIEEYAE